MKGVEVAPRDVVAAALPDPATLGERMSGKTCAGTLVTGIGKDGRPRKTYLYHVVDNEWSMREYGHQAVVWQTALNPAVALELLATGAWSGAGVLGPEAFPAQPFLDMLAELRLPPRCRRARAVARRLTGSRWIPSLSLYEGAAEGKPRHARPERPRGCAAPRLRGRARAPRAERRRLRSPGGDRLSEPPPARGGRAPRERLARGRRPATACLSDEQRRPGRSGFRAARVGALHVMPSGRFWRGRRERRRDPRALPRRAPARAPRLAARGTARAARGGGPSSRRNPGRRRRRGSTRQRRHGAPSSGSARRSSSPVG